jgi:ferredoxin
MSDPVVTEANSLLEWLNGWGDAPNWSDSTGMTVPVVKASLRRVLERVVAGGIPGCVHCGGSGRCLHCNVASQAR